MPLAQRANATWLASVGGTGVRITRYPALAAGTQLKASGNTTGAFKYAAAGANVKAIVAKATIGVNCKIVGVVLDTASATSIFVIKLGNGAAAGGAMTAELIELVVENASAAGGSQTMMIPGNVQAVIIADGATDAILGDAASSNAAADDTINAAVLIATAYGT